jgi:hypothetical protein
MPEIETTLFSFSNRYSRKIQDYIKNLIIFSTFHKNHPVCYLIRNQNQQCFINFIQFNSISLYSYTNPSFSIELNIFYFVDFLHYDLIDPLHASICLLLFIIPWWKVLYFIKSKWPIWFKLQTFLKFGKLLKNQKKSELQFFSSFSILTLKLSQNEDCTISSSIKTFLYLANTTHFQNICLININFKKSN